MEALKNILEVLRLDMVIEYPNRSESTIALLTVQRNLSSLLQAMLESTNGFKNPENINIMGLSNGLCDMLEWICDQTEIILGEEHNGSV